MEKIDSIHRPKILVISDYNDFHSVRPEAEIFLSLRAIGYNISVMTFGDSKYATMFKKAGINVIDHHPTRKYQASSIKKIKSEIDHGKYDVIHLFNNKALINGLVASKYSSIVKIGYRGSLLNFSMFNPFNYFKHLSPSLDYVICNSQGVADNYKKHPYFNSDKVVVINKGHNLSWYSQVKPINHRSSFHIEDDVTIFILVATDRTAKGVKYLCEAVNLLPDETNFRLLLIGNGMESKIYRDILDKGAHSSKVVAQGHNADALSYVAGADVFVLPSIKGESITKAVLESMSLGKCPIITDIPGNAELVEHGKNGLVVPKKNAKKLAKAMLRLCNDRAIISKFGKTSKMKIETQLNHQKTVKGYEALYERIMSKPRN